MILQSCDDPMLTILLAFLTSSRSYAVIHYPCAANIDGDFDNTTSIAASRPIRHLTDFSHEFDYYIQICNSLDPSAIPPGIPTQFGASAIRVRRSTNESERSLSTTPRLTSSVIQGSPTAAS
jgi:hypothetical protein